MNRQLIVYGAIGLGTVTILVLYVLFAYIPLSKKLETQKEKLALQQQRFDEEEGLLARADEFSQWAVKLGLDQGRLDTQLPLTDEMPSLLKAVTLAATAGRMKQLQFAPQPLIKKEGYSELRIQLTASCRYHALGEFMSKLTALPRLVTIEVVEINQLDKTGTNDSIQATLMLVTYVRNK